MAVYENSKIYIWQEFRRQKFYDSKIKLSLSKHTYLLVADNIAWLFCQEKLEKLGHMQKAKLFKPFLLSLFVKPILNPQW